MKFSASLVTTFAAFLLPSADAFFRMPCSGPLLLERSDPIVNPGAVSAHLHNIVGGNGFNFTMSYNSAVTSSCSSCKAKADKSNYWVPDLYVKTKRGQFHNVGNGGATIYYLQRRGSNNKDQKLVPFPKGFRMLAGNPMLRSGSRTLAQRAVSFACLGGTTGETPYIPDSKCPYGLRAQIVMPSCWNGKDLDSPNHKDHVAYPDGVDNGNCPPTHPHRFVTLFFEFFYDIAKWDSEWVNGKHPWVLSNGDPTGYGYHGDFINGWDINILDRAINECNAASGVIEECKVLELYTNREMDDCAVPPSLDEPVTGFMDKLPGCNPVQFGPGRATQQTNCGVTTTIGPKKDFSTNVSAKGWQYVDCANDDLGSRSLPYRYATKDMTVEKCVDHCGGKGYTYAGLQYSEECFCGNSIATDRLGAQKCTMPCGGNPKQYCGGPQKLSLYKKKGVTKRSAPRSNVMVKKHQRAQHIHA